MNKILLFLRHAFALIREDKLFSAIYIAGTAVAIASAMVIAIVFNMLIADIEPESNRSRTLYLYSRFIQGEPADLPYHQGHSTAALDSCFRRMACVEAATGVLPAAVHRFSASNEQLTHDLSISSMPTDPDFFRLYNLTFLEGRPFSEAEFRKGERVCVVSDKVWEKVGGEGSTLILNNLPFHVVGIVKSVSAFMSLATADVYLPYTVSDMGFYPNTKNLMGDVFADVSYSGNLNVRVLLREGCTRRDFVTEVGPLRQHYNAVCTSAAGEKMEWMLDVDSHIFRIINFFRFKDDDYGAVTMAINLMVPGFLMFLFLLLPAVNLSGLVSNRMEARRAEMGIRKAFGAKRRTLLREVIRENLVLTLCGGLVGWVLSWLFILAIRRNSVFLQLFVSTDQNTFDTSLDFKMFVTPTLFLIVFVCCALLNLMVALIPAWASLRKPIVESLNQKR